MTYAIWHRSHQSVLAPYGDAISYLQKARAFWQAMYDGGWFNPFDLEPSIRPPGTVLMSYPFGVTVSSQGFYFRSVFLPILMTAVAVYVAAGRRAIVHVPWTVAAIAALLASLPMFYWFDWNSARWINNGFGMVDNFQAGVAALATAAMVRTLTDKSLTWQCACTFLFCLTFTIKQSGLMLMGLMGLVSLALVLVEARRLRRSGAETGLLLRYSVGSTGVIVLLYTGCIAAAYFSAYLSADHFRWAIRALGYYRSVTAGISWAVFHVSLGEVLLLGLVASLILAVTSSARRRGFPTATLLAIGGLIVWMLGLWYWLVPQGGGPQVRYFYPFALMGLILVVPLAVNVWSGAPRVVRGLGATVCLAASLNIAALLAAGRTPSNLWQTSSGVSVSVGEGADESAMADAFLRMRRLAGSDAKVYIFPQGAEPYYFINAGVYAKIMNPGLPSFSQIDPMDWSRGFTVRAAELEDTKYVLNRKYSPAEAAAATAPKSMDTFEMETTAFDARISTLDERAGVKVLIDGQRLRLLEVTDPVSFSRSIDTFVGDHAWRPEFRDANAPIWWNAADLADGKRASVASEVQFGDAYIVHAVSVTRVGEAVKVEAWWEPGRTASDTPARDLFFHLVDANGVVIKKLEVPLSLRRPPSPERTWRHDSATFEDVSPHSVMTTLAFGIYQPGAADGGLLLADKGRRDWGDKRVLVPLP